MSGGESAVIVTFTKQAGYIPTNGTGSSPAPSLSTMNDFLLVGGIVVVVLIVVLLAFRKKRA
jgi:hypothetical protein